MDLFPSLCYLFEMKVIFAQFKIRKTSYHGVGSSDLKYSLGPKTNIRKCKPNIHSKCQLEKPCNPCVKFIQWTIMHNVIFLTPFLSSPITLGFCMLLKCIYFLMMAIFVLSNSSFKLRILWLGIQSMVFIGGIVKGLYCPCTSSVFLSKSTKTCV